MLAIAELTSKKKRLAEEENGFLLLWKITFICVSNLNLRKIQKLVHDSVADEELAADCREGQ